MSVETIAVIGTGEIGRQIAYLAARGGYRTVVEDASPERLEQSVAWLKQALGEEVMRGEIAVATINAAQQLIVTAQTVEEAIRGADLIIEAVPDELEMKLELFTLFDKFARPGAILASSSGAFSIGEMTDVTTSQERCIGMRFYNSSESGAVIEIVKTALTSGETVAACLEVVSRMGREAAVVEESAATAGTQNAWLTARPVSGSKS